MEKWSTAMDQKMDQKIFYKYFSLQKLQTDDALISL